MSLFSFSDPWYDLRNLQKAMDRLIEHYPADEIAPATDNAGKESGSQEGRLTRRQLEMSRWSPHVDVTDTEKSIIVHAELPGCNKEDIKLSIEKNRLVLQGEKHTHKKEKRDSWVCRERFEGSFVRTLTLPSGVDPSQIQANYSNGVLEVVIPKPQDQQSKQHMIEIKTLDKPSTKEDKSQE